MQNSSNFFESVSKATASLKTLDDGLFYMEYYGDFLFEEFLKSGGAKSDIETESVICKAVENAFCNVKQPFGCSTLCAKDKNSNTFMGRNFDWGKCDAMILYAEPKDSYKSISTCNLNFIGYGNYSPANQVSLEVPSDYASKKLKPVVSSDNMLPLIAMYSPLDGINEMGLCVADLTNGDVAEVNQTEKDKDITVLIMIRLLLNKAKNVSEAIKLLQEYNMHFSMGLTHHLSVSDRKGNSIVVEYVNNRMIITDTKVVTNHYLSKGEKFGVGDSFSHERFNILQSCYDKNHGVLSNLEIKESMVKAFNNDLTQWTVIYDKIKNTSEFYWRRNMDKKYFFEMK